MAETNLSVYGMCDNVHSHSWRRQVKHLGVKASVRTRLADVFPWACQHVRLEVWLFFTIILREDQHMRIVPQHEDILIFFHVILVNSVSCRSALRCDCVVDLVHQGVRNSI